jgi:hypothetical protein
MNKVMVFLLFLSLSWFLIVYSIYLKIKSYGESLEGDLKGFYIGNSSLVKVKPFIEEGKVKEIILNGFKMYKKDGKILIEKIKD